MRDDDGTSTTRLGPHLSGGAATLLRRLPAFVLTCAPSVIDPAETQLQVEFGDGSIYPIFRVSGSTDEELTAHEAKTIALLWMDRKRVFDELANIRCKAEAIIRHSAMDPANRIGIVGYGISPLMIRIGHRRPHAETTPTIDIRIRGLAGDLAVAETSRRGRPRDILNFVRSYCRQQSDCLKRRSRALRHGVDGVVDKTLLRAIDGVGLDTTEALRSIGAATAADPVILKSIDGEMKLTAEWRGGRATTLMSIGGAARVAENRVTLMRRELPKEALETLVGKGLRSIFDHPALGDPRVMRIVAFLGELHIDLQRGERCFDRVTGRLV